MATKKPRKRKAKSKVELKDIKENIVQVDYREEMEQSYLDYSMSVITDRALPDVRDGLKPVHRRILYAMSEAGMTHSKAYNKCAEIVGNVLGGYHPHGDSSVYGALVRLAQDFSLRSPLIDGHGNFGSIDGDSAAHMRYTEARLQKLSDELLGNLKYDTVTMVPNFNEKKVEPVVLPATFPNLLINGGTGIAVGMMTSIPTHNLNETIDCIIKGLEKPKSTTLELLEVLKGPDFPTGGIITNEEELAKIYEEGVGSITIRGKYHIEEAGSRKMIVITEIPYTLSGKKETFVESIIQLAQKYKQLQITSVRDETSKEGIRIVVEVKKDMDINTVVSYLYKYTSFEDNFKFSFLCLDKGKPVLMSLKQYVDSFIEFQKEIYTNKFNYLYNKNKIQIEKLQGLVIAYDYIDQIISIVRKADSVADMRTALKTGNVDKIQGLTAKDKKIINKFSFTDIQTEVILETRLYELSKLKLTELESNIEKLEKENKTYHGLLNSNTKMKNHIKKMLNEIKKNYGDKRKTSITSKKTKFIPIIENYEVTIDENNYAKRIKVSNDTNSVSEDTKISIITEDSSVYLVPIKNLPIGNARDKGVALENFTDGNEIAYAFIPEENKQILTIDTEGYGKIVDHSEFVSSRKFLKGYLKDSKILLARELGDEKTIISKNSAGKEKKFKISNLPVGKRTTKGKKVVTGKFEIESVELN
jgi:DNA gyrase subunit A